MDEEALRSGQIQGAGLDVFEEEPTSADNPLLRLKNVVATPHIAGRSQEVEQNQIETSMREIERFLAGRRPQNLLNAELMAERRTRAGKLQ